MCTNAGPYFWKMRFIEAGREIIKTADAKGSLRLRLKKHVDDDKELHKLIQERADSAKVDDLLMALYDILWPANPLDNDDRIKEAIDEWCNPLDR